MSQKVYDIVTQTILDKLEAGTIPWQKPWQATNGQLPANLISGKAYRGFNVFVLACQGYSNPYWLTLNQARKIKAKLRKGESYTPVLFYNFKKELDEKGREYTIPMCRFYKVFNVSQFETIEHSRLTELARQEDLGPVIDPIVKADSIVMIYQRKGPKLSHDGNRAFYSPERDAVTMPPKASFAKSEGYYSILFHELAHSTGHRDRLAREGVVNPARFGSHTYSKEELVAEMASAFLCAESGIEANTIDNQAAYIASWIKVLKNDRKLIVQAASESQKAVDFMLGRKWDAEKGRMI